MSTPYGEKPASDPGDGPANPYDKSAQGGYGSSSYDQSQQYGQPGPYGQPSPYGQPDPYGQSPAPYAPQPAAAYGQPYGGAAPEHPQGTLILVFGIIGIFSGIFAPVAWYLGNKARKEIAASGTRYANESNINIGRVLGMVFTIIYLAVIVLSIVFSIVIVAIAGSQGG